MPEFITVQKKVERRTYLKGRFTGKFVGYLDLDNSDLKHENFYDLEILNGQIFANKSDFRTWKEGTEFEEFLGVEKFLIKLPDSIPCEISYEDGRVKNFSIHLHQPKLSNYRLFNALYEGNKVFATIEGNICGYLLHYDLEDKQIALPPPPPQIPSPVFTNSSARFLNYGVKVNTGQNKPVNFQPINRIDWDRLVSGCFLGIVLLAFGCFISVAMVIAGAIIVSSLSAFGIIVFSLILTQILPFLLIGIILYAFVNHRYRLPPILGTVLHLIIILLVILFISQLVSQIN